MPTETPRNQFLEAVRTALARPNNLPLPPAEHPVVNTALYRQVAPDEPNLVERYITVATAGGMRVEATDSGSVLAAIDRCLANHKISLLLLNAHSYEDRYYLADHLAGRQIPTFRWGDPDCRAQAFQCEAAITDCRFAMADNGALAVWSDSSFGRSSTLTMPVHIVLLAASQILPDLADGFARLAGITHGNLPSNVVFISGPSKTADIEMNLVTGVHGPKYLYIILIRDL